MRTKKVINVTINGGFGFLTQYEQTLMIVNIFHIV